MPGVGAVGRSRSRARWSFFVAASREASEPFVLEDLGDRNRAERDVVLGEGPADVVDREVLLAERNDEFADGIGRGNVSRPFG